MLEPSAIEPETIRPLLRVEYDRMVELGMFADERVELLCGQLVTMSAQGGAHSAITAWFGRKLNRALDDDYEIRSHSPYAATENSEPEPDVSVALRPRRLHEHPSAALLLIEVSDSSLRKDRKIKARIYAQNCAPEYWIVDIARAVVEVYTQPVEGRYTQMVELRAGDVLRPHELPQIAMAVADIPFAE